MAKFPDNPHRHDPYKNFKFRVKWGGRYVAGFSKISALERSTEVIEHREGGAPSTVHKAPGSSKYEPITLERGVTLDVEFERWANKVWSYPKAKAAADQRTQQASLNDFRKDIIIDVFNESGQKVISYNVYRCWVSEFQALPDLDGNAKAVAIQSIELENEGWHRDTDCRAPEEPTA